MRKICLLFALCLLLAAAATARAGEVTLPEGLETIESEAFAGSGLREIHLPASLKSIAEDAFAGCEGLRVMAPVGSYAYTWAANNGLLAAEAYPASTQVSVAASLRAGENLTVQVIGPQNAVYHNIFLLGPSVKNGVKSLRVKAGTVEWPGYQLEPGEYKVIVYSVTEEYGTLPPITNIVTVAGEKAPGPALALPETAQENTEVRITIDRQMAIRCVYYDQSGILQYDYTNIFYPDDILWIDTWAGDGEEDAYSEYTAAEYCDGAWTAWGPTSRVTIVPLPKLDAPEITLPDEVPAGRNLTFTISGMEHIDYCSLGVYPVEDDRRLASVYNTSFSADKTVTIPGYELSAGQYVLSLYMEPDSELFQDTSVEKYFSAVGAQPAAPSATTDHQDIYMTNDRVPIQISAPGAEGYIVRYYVPSKDGSSINGAVSFSSGTLDESGNGVCYAEHIWGQDTKYIGKYDTYQFAVFSGDTWSLWSEPVKLLIKEREPLQKAIIDAPESIQAGYNLNFSFAPVEHATSYTIRIQNSYSYDSIYWFASDLAQPNTTLTLPGNYLARGNYRIIVSASSDEYGSIESEAQFTVTGNRPAAPSISVDKTTVYENENFTFTIDTTDVEELRYNTSSNTYYSETIRVLDDETKWTTYAYSAGEQQYRFSALIGDQWTAWSEPITITVKVTDPMSEPSFALADALAAGQDLTVTVDEVPGASYYYVYLLNGRGTELDSRYIGNSSGGTVVFRGYHIAAGVVKVKVIAYGRNVSSTATSSLRVAAGSRPDAPDAELTAENIFAGRAFTFAIDTEGAEKAAVRYYRDGNTGDVSYTLLDATEVATNWSNTISTVGETWLFSFAVQKEGVWSPWSDSKTFTVQETPRLSAPVIHAESSYTAGKDFNIGFDAVDNAESYYYILYDAVTNSRYASGRYSEAQEILFFGYQLEPGTYKLTIRAESTEYINSTAECNFTVTPSPLSAPNVSVDKTTVYENESVTFTIDTTGVEELRYKTSATTLSSNVIRVLDNETKWTTYAYSAGEWQYRFSALIDDQWTGWSEPITVTVKATDPMPEPTFSLPDALAAGQDLSVTVNEVIGANSYRVYLLNGRGTELDSRYIDSSSGGTAVFMGYHIAAGVVKVKVITYGRNASSTATSSLRVAAGSRPDAPDAELTAENIFAGSSFTFAIDTESAEKTAIRYYQEGYTGDVRYVVRDAAGQITNWKNTLSTAGDTWIFSFAVQKDGVWSPWSDSKAFTVQEAPL